MIDFNINVFKSDKPNYEMKNALGRLDTLKDNIYDASMQSVSKTLETGKQIAKQYHDAAPKTGTQKSVIFTKTLNSGQGGYIVLYGREAFYEEFGTGNEGLRNPHPTKSLYNLNDYNSGPIVSRNLREKGKAYWRYNLKDSPYHDPETGYTEGVPAGKQMYNTAKDLRKEANKIAKEIIENAIKTKALK